MSQLTLSAILKIVDQATRPLKAVQQQTEQSSEAIAHLDRTIDRLNRSLNSNNAQRYNQSLRQTQQNTSAVRLATHLLVNEYHEVSHALTSVINKAEQLNASFAKSRQSMRQQFKNMLFTGGAAGLGAYQFLKPAIDFEKQMSGVQAVLDLDKTSQQMKMLTQDARKWGAASSFSPTEAAAAQFALGSGGFTPQQIHEALGGTLQLAEAGKVELEQAAQIAVGSLNGFGLEAKEIGRVNDVFLQATNATATSVQGLGETMKYVAPIAKAYGASIEATTAMTGLLGNNNILDTQAGTSLRGIMTRLAAPPNEAADALALLKVRTSDKKGNMREMADIFAEINKKTAQMGEAQRLDIFKSIAGQEAISAFAVLVDQSAVLDKNSGKTVNKIKELTKQLENSQGAAARAAAILKDNLAGDIENMGGAWQDLSISVANVLKNDLRGFVKQITETIDRIKAWVDANPELVRTIASLAVKLLMFKVAMLSVRYTGNLLFGSIFSLIAGMTKLGLALWVVRLIAAKLGLGVPSRLRIMTRLTMLLGRAFIFLSQRAIPLVLMGLRAMAVAMLTNPLTWIIALIAVVALVIYRYWAPIKAFFAGFWTGLKQGLAPLGATLSSTFASLKTTLAPLKPLWDGIVAVWRILKGVVSEMLTPYQATNQELKNATSYGQRLGAVLGTVLKFIGNAVIQLGTDIGEFVGWIVMLPDRVVGAFNSLKIMVIDAGNTFINFLLAPIRQVITAVNTLIAGMNRIPTIKIPLIPQIPQIGANPLPAGKSSGGVLPTKPITPVQTRPVIPMRASAGGSQQVNHFAAPNISITGVTDTKQVGSIVDQKLKQFQLAQAASQRRAYTDQA